MNASVKSALLIRGVSSVSPLVAIKGRERLLPEAPKCINYGFSLVFLPLSSSSLCSPFQREMLEENLRVTREAPATSSYHSLAFIGSILNIMFLHLPMRQVLCGLVESNYVILLEFLGWDHPRTDISGGKAWSCHKVFREKEKFLCKMLQEDLRGDYCNLPPYSCSLSPWIQISLFPKWE